LNKCLFYVSPFGQKEIIEKFEKIIAFYKEDIDKLSKAYMDKELYKKYLDNSLEWNKILTVLYSELTDLIRNRVVNSQ